MSQPRPRYEPPQPEKLSFFKFSLKELLVVVVIVTIFAAIIFPIFADATTRSRHVACLSNGKQLTIATQMYSKDYDDHLPQATSWYTGLQYYLTYPNQVCTLRTKSQGVGYAMDERLSGRSLEKIGASHAKRPLLYESSNFTPNAHDSGTSFAGRHKGTGWVGFVDGHVKGGFTTLP
ncbi:type II secretion system protein [Armatimonas sp.]|uniref:type II secretion system protein n=1 Tax=Armatimonas sp. TaxID=1872638 RepID=UPI00374D48C3